MRSAIHVKYREEYMMCTGKPVLVKKKERCLQMGQTSICLKEPESKDSPWNRNILTLRKRKSSCRSNQ